MAFDPNKVSKSGIDAVAAVLNEATRTVANQSFRAQNSYDNPKVEWLSHGDGINEFGDNYSHGEGSHNIRLLKFVSPDIMLVHQSRMVGFYMKLSTSRELRVVQRDVKNLLLKDVRY